ncbi:hypothetical protein BAE44_0014248 [Dichanthelium oligosanthes]|uniref:Uncharacterized protein n=1 Tax=Dichanthelium oligosanthes TaxID=888268 RepID=A0A1E5VHY9_9POAL|nr:hypothetical protein BAE44_0014248 [Dichanthelium oligosanthes]
MDREVWLMLLGYPNDCRDASEIEKSLVGFGILKHVHRSTNIAHVIVKMLVNKEDDVLDEIVVSPGDSSRAPSWTVRVFILHACDLAVAADEDALPPDGPLHPMPHLEPHWGDGDAPVAGLNRATLSVVVNVRDGEASANCSLDALGTLVNDAGVAVDPELSGATADFIASSGMDPLLFEADKFPSKAVQVDVPSSAILLRDALVKMADSDLLWHLTKVVLDPQDRGFPVSKESANVDSDVEVINKMPPLKTPRTRRARKPRAPLDVGCGCSQKAMDLDAEPLEVVLPVDVAYGALVTYKGQAASSGNPAPDLPLDLIQSIATSFLKMQPGAVSDEALLASSSDDE